MRIATFNLENLDEGPGVEPPLAARLPILRPQIMRLRADVLCLQEVNGQRGGKGRPRDLSALDTLIEALPCRDFNRAFSESPSGGPSDRHNLVVLSRFPIIATAQYRNDLVEAPAYRPATADPRAESAEPVMWDRPILHVTVSLDDGRPLHLINLHLRAPSAAPVEGQKLDPSTWRSAAGWGEGCYIASMKRSGQALEARILIDRLFDADTEALILVCGDLNATEDEVPVRILCGSDEDTNNGALAACALVPLERSVDRGRRYSVLHHGKPQMLDHILASQALLGWYTGIEVHNEHLSDEMVPDIDVVSAPESYHAPLVASFEPVTLP